MNSKYNVGDKVKICDDLQNGVRYGNDTFVGDDGIDLNMAAYLGKVVTIRTVMKRMNSFYYRIEGDCEGWNWTDEMIDKKISACKFMTSL